MNKGSIAIEGGDYEHSGAATQALKELLKKAGVKPGDMRRAVIAAYEAEMNIIIHARRGQMLYEIRKNGVDVTLADEGPGIADIELAMKEGYSTAPEEARKLGFGAGMGLPNIKANSDILQIKSTPGQGTTVFFSVNFRESPSGAVQDNSIGVEAGKCIRCMRCLHVCPTAAIRAHGGTPAILDHLCIDCTACIKVCGAKALVPRGAEWETRFNGCDVLVVPAAFLVEFGPKVSPRRVIEALNKLGAGEVRILEEWEASLRDAVCEYVAGTSHAALPVLSPVCPAAVNLIAVKFPSLLENIAPFLFPAEAAVKELAGKNAVIMAGCPAGLTLLKKTAKGTGITIIGPAPLRHAVFELLAAPEAEPLRVKRAKNRSREGGLKGIMRVENISHNVSVLEKVENGLLNDMGILEIFACEAGCFGSPVFVEDAYIARIHWQKAQMEGGRHGKAFRRDGPIQARPGMRLDEDIGEAIKKLSLIAELTRQLPGRDCGMCGAPSCGAMAEDIVLGRAAMAECVYLSKAGEEKNK